MRVLTYSTESLLSMTLKSKLYTSYVRSHLTYDSKTWPVKMEMEHEVQLDKNEVSVIRWMYGFI